MSVFNTNVFVIYVTFMTLAAVYWWVSEYQSSRFHLRKWF